jgi:hypothetical protein
MDQSKPWWASKGLWAGVVAVLTPIIAAAFHVTVSAEDTATAVNLVSGIVESVAGLVAIYGRVSATKQISK